MQISRLSDTKSPLYGVSIGSVSSLLIQTLSSLDLLQREPAPYDPTKRPEYYTPPTLDVATRASYCQAIDQVIDTYKHAHDTISKHLASESNNKRQNEQAVTQATRQLLPVSATQATSLTIHNRYQANVIQTLVSSSLPEAEELISHLAREQKSGSRKFSRPVTEYDFGHSLDHDYFLRLASANIRNELDLLPAILFEHSGVSYDELSSKIVDWPIEQKISTYQKYLESTNDHASNSKGSALEQIVYKWEVMSDYASMRTYSDQKPYKQVSWQLLTPRYGFDVPKLAEDAGLLDTYEKCYELSFALHSSLQAAGYTSEAQYATLHGHKLRWQFTHTAADLMAMVASIRGQMDPIVTGVMRHLGGIHPLLTECISRSAKMGNERGKMGQAEAA